MSSTRVDYLAVLFLALPWAMLPQGPLTPGLARPRPSPEAPAGTIRVEAPLVLIPVHVVTPNGASVTDLLKERFHLFDDNSERNITYFVKEDAPVSIGVLLDTSASMQHKMRRSSEAAARVLETANPTDEFFLIEFNERPKLTVPFTSDTDRLYRRFMHAGPFGRTSLLDALHLASVQMKNARNARKALLIVSDGGDNHSRMSRSQARSEVLESDLQMYAIGIFDGDTRQRSPEEANGPGLLEELAGETGGRHYRVDNLDEMASVAHRISIDMRNEYLLGFTPAGEQSDGKYHRIKVTVNPSDGTKLNVFYRRGYYAPAQ
jgi:Ca-activated chloride channel homolog